MREADQITSNVAMSELRPAQTVMKLARMGSFHQSRLSFMRVLLRRLKQNGWQFDRPVFNIDARGIGVAAYRARGPESTYTLVAFSHELDSSQRSDRVIAEAWDATFTLCDGEVDVAQIERLASHVPRQEAGRLDQSEMVLSRANKSVRLFSHVLDALTRGEQPDPEMIESVGYLFRTTAVYGAGKFGAADRERWADRPEFTGSFQPEMLAVWLIRTFSIDLVEHLAMTAAPDKAVTLDRSLRRRFGVGNSTGLGMAPFLINHPRLIHSWIKAREVALARVRALTHASRQDLETFRTFVSRARQNALDWQVEDDRQTEKTKRLRRDLDWIAEQASRLTANHPAPWDQLYRKAETQLSLEGQEALVSLMFEPYSELVDDLASSMCADETTPYRIDGSISVSKTLDDLAAQYDWTESIDFASEAAQARVWYVSEEKLEPRLGERFEEPLEPYEQPLSPGRDAVRMRHDLKGFVPDATIGEFLLRHPEHRHIARRLQLVNQWQYGEIRNNTIAADMVPIDLLRCKLSFFGATKFDPRSDRWLRITMYQGAPFPDELYACDPDDMAYPPLSEGNATG